MTRRPQLEALVCSLAVVSLLLLIVARDFPMVGHDHRYYVPRLLDTELFVRTSGYFNVQWYTPTFGGGLPAFPNPQHLQHSILQVLTRVIDPWRAILVTTALVSFIGFFALRGFLLRSVGVASRAATLGAVLFVGNGFYIEHMIVGHIGYQLFPLSAVILYALTDRNTPVLGSGAIVSLVLAAMLFHAGTYLIILTALSWLVVLPLLALVRVPVDVRRIALIVATGMVLTALMTASKLYAVLAFLRQFPREIADVYNVSVVQAVAGFALQFTGAMTVAPMMFVAGVDPARLEGALSRLTGATVQVGIWELDTSLSPVTWVVLVVGAFRARTRGGRAPWPRLDRQQKIALAVLVVMTWVMVEATLARGWVYPLIKPLPILRSLHVNHRIASVFLVPFIIATVMVVNQWQASPRGRRFAVVLLCVAVVSPLAYFLFPARVHQRSFDISSSLAVHKSITRGDSLPVSRIMNLTDAEALAQGASSYRPYEPLFGYGLETFHPEVVVGDVHQVSGGRYNLTNPVSLVFPQENGLMPFERIAGGDREAMDAFVRRAPTPWRPPALYSRLAWVSWMGLVATLALAVSQWRLHAKGGAL